MTATQWDILSHEFGAELYSEALYRLTRLEMRPPEARECLLSIVGHQQQLAQQLGRGVSLITASCDYFTHVNPVVREPILLEMRLLLQKEDSVYRDELTGLFNRRSFNQEVPREMERFRRFGQPFSLLMLDLDHFKAFNDTHGHSAGDQALRDVAQILLETARLYDRVVRYGGEEFAIILPQTSEDEALVVAERIREAMQNHHISFGGQDLGAITASIGLACFPKDGLDMQGLVLNADFALYQAKIRRNCVEKFQDSKRNHPRYLLSDPLPVSLQTMQDTALKADAWDVSLGGLRCTSASPLPFATPLNLVLSDASRSIHLPLQAVVRRITKDESKGYELGLAFRLECVEDQMKLMALLDGRMGACSPRRTRTAGQATA